MSPAAPGVMQRLRPCRRGVRIAFRAASSSRSADLAGGERPGAAQVAEAIQYRRARTTRRSERARLRSAVAGREHSSHPPELAHHDPDRSPHARPPPRWRRRRRPARSAIDAAPSRLSGDRGGARCQPARGAADPDDLLAGGARGDGVLWHYAPADRPGRRRALILLTVVASLPRWSARWRPASSGCGLGRGLQG